MWVLIKSALARGYYLGINSVYISRIHRSMPSGDQHRSNVHHWSQCRSNFLNKDRCQPLLWIFDQCWSLLICILDQLQRFHQHCALIEGVLTYDWKFLLYLISPKVGNEWFSILRFPLSREESTKISVNNTDLSIHSFLWSTNTTWRGRIAHNYRK